MYRIMDRIIALSQAMELGRFTNEAAKTTSSKGLFARLNLTGSTLWDADGSFQATPNFDINLQRSSLRQIRRILVIEKEVRTLRSPQIDSSSE